MTGQPPEANYTNATFRGRPDSVSAFLNAVSSEIQCRPVKRVLDLGCGTGDLALALASRFPGIEFTALDISSNNIEVARRRADECGLEDRIVFAAADFTQWPGGRFDAILADSVLHLIPGSDLELARKLALHLEPGAILLTVMPAACFRNSLLLVQRKLWSMTPQTFDKLALAAARLVYSAESEEILADRVGYMRLLPYRLLSNNVFRTLNEAGLELLTSQKWPSPSIFKLEHHFAVIRRSPN